MEKKVFALKNLGMNRDLSISKMGETNAYENFNIRILARDKDTLLSVTNERGNCEIPFGDAGEDAINGEYLLGWNVLNDYLILFMKGTGTNDYIYRVKFDSETPTVTKLFPTTYQPTYTSLGFDVNHPIESVVYYESETVQKIYWLDGLNPLRMMNFVADGTEMEKWDDTYFDANRDLRFGASVEISKDNSGNARPNGTIQYLLTYYNKHGQESGYAWMSDIVYLSPINKGGAADETNNNKVTLKFHNLDTRYTNYRVYSVFRSSYDGQAVSYVVGEGEVTTGAVYVVDDAANQEAVDASKLLFLGSRSVTPYTMAHKDDTLFLGRLDVHTQNYQALEAAIAQHMRNEDGSCKSGIIAFEYSENDDSSPYNDSIPYVDEYGLYPYKNQLTDSSSKITTFKGNEKYRFALSFRTKSGLQTEAFWIGDATNTLYPIIDATNKIIKRVVVKCDIPPQVIEIIVRNNLDASVVQLMIAEASYADRSVKAQGVITPTMFNVWSRYNDRLFAIPSWSTRPRNSVIANRHFDVVNNATQSTGEIECNYWNTEQKPTPYYTWLNYDNTSTKKYGYDYEGKSEAQYAMLVLGFHTASTWGSYGGIRASLYYIRASDNNGVSFANKIDTINFADNEYKDLFVEGGSKQKHYTDTTNNPALDYTLYVDNIVEEDHSTFVDAHKLYVKLKKKAIEVLNLPTDAIFISEERFIALYKSSGWFPVHVDRFDQYSKAEVNAIHTEQDAANNKHNLGSSFSRWITDVTASLSTKVGYVPAYSTQHLMFVDENIVTLNSPEIFYESVSLDNVDRYKLRIVGVAKISSCISDYTVVASHGQLAGSNLSSVSFSGEKNGGVTYGLQAWPLWNEHSLVPKEETSDFTHPSSVYDYTSADYVKSPGGSVKYWLHTFGKSGPIDGYTDDDGNSDGVIKNKVFANLRFAYDTIYNSDRTKDWEQNLESIRLFNSPSSQVMTLDVGNHAEPTYDKVNYDASIDELLSLPGTLKYPIKYSAGAVDAGTKTDSSACFLYSNIPVQLQYDSSPHVIMSFESERVDDGHGLDIYQQTILPVLNNEQDVNIPDRDVANHKTGALVPWIESETANQGHSVNPSIDTPIVINLSVPSDEFELYAYGGGEAPVYLGLYQANIATSQLVQDWQACSQKFGTQPFFARIQVSSNNEAYDDKIFLVDISGFYLDGTDYLMIADADVAGIAESGDHDVKLNVDMWTYDRNANPKFVNVGYKTLEVGTGLYDDVPGYPYLDYKIDSSNRIFDIRPDTTNGASTVDGLNDEYVFIGEVYYPYGEEGIPDTRYGDVKNNRFVIAGPEYPVSGMSTTTGHNYIVGNQGDTYFQRWDDLRIKPHSTEEVNGVVDIVSVMLETHINIDGRSDNNRGTKYIASMNNAQFDSINKAYSQPNDFVTRRDLDSDFNQSSYPSHITWTLQKAPMAEVDEWMHITLANNLALDGDRGHCNALRKFNNTIFAFQDRCISEILFNSRTQMATTSGVPVELMNSGKVDGKRIITNSFGCVNKWSIVEGKQALYFVDNINKAFCAFNGTNLENLSYKNGFEALFRNVNSTEKWNPRDWSNLVSFYDRENSDVYLMTEFGAVSPNSASGCLVYSETLGMFTTFFGYHDVPMMTNIGSDFIAFRKNQSDKNALWLQNQGAYCNFFGNQENFFVSYNVTPEPYGDKVWTNLEYRADFFKDLDDDNISITHEQLLDGGQTYNSHIERYEDGDYLDKVTFDTLQVWNEYQHTPVFTADASNKKFRIWRTVIPRAVKTETNKYSLDRIRNPWLRLFMGKSIKGDENKELMQLHDVNVVYYE